MRTYYFGKIWEIWLCKWKSIYKHLHQASKPYALKGTITHSPPQQHVHSTRENNKDVWGEASALFPLRTPWGPWGPLSLQAGGRDGSSGWCYMEVWRSVKGKGSVECGWSNSMWEGIRNSNYILLIVSTNAKP